MRNEGTVIARGPASEQGMVAAHDFIRAAGEALREIVRTPDTETFPELGGGVFGDPRGWKPWWAPWSRAPRG